MTPGNGAALLGLGLGALAIAACGGLGLWLAAALFHAAPGGIG